MDLESFMVRRISRHLINAQALLFRGDPRLAMAARARALRDQATLALMRSWRLV